MQNYNFWRETAFKQVATCRLLQVGVGHMKLTGATWLEITWPEFSNFRSGFSSMNNVSSFQADPFILFLKMNQKNSGATRRRSLFV